MNPAMTREEMQVVQGRKFSAAFVLTAALS
jgi:hypothetical protein